jgi:hypothetical protein
MNEKKEAWRNMKRTERSWRIEIRLISPEKSYEEWRE